MKTPSPNTPYRFAEHGELTGTYATADPDKNRRARRAKPPRAINNRAGHHIVTHTIEGNPRAHRAPEVVKFRLRRQLVVKREGGGSWFIGKLTGYNYPVITERKQVVHYDERK